MMDFEGIDKVRISIHAPRVGSDLKHEVEEWKHENISIHAPRVGSDLSQCTFLSHCGKFQSTLPVWGATGAQAHGTQG